MHSSPHPSARLPGNIVATQGPSRFSRLLIAGGSSFIYETTRRREKSRSKLLSDSDTGVYSFHLCTSSYTSPSSSSPCYASSRSFSTGRNFSDFFSLICRYHARHHTRFPSLLPRSKEKLRGAIKLSVAISFSNDAMRCGHVRTMDSSRM